jgi:hypothetical protein
VKRDRFLTFILLLTVQLSSSVLGQTVGVKISTPENWVAGNWSVVELEISGGSGAGPCRFVQDFPVGFSVRPTDMGGGDLFFDKGSLNIVWSKLPAEGRSRVIFEVMPDNGLSGLIELGGLLYAVTGSGIRTIVSVPPKNIFISAGVASADERQQVTRAAKNIPAAATIREQADNKIGEPVTNQVGGVQYRVQVLSSSSRIDDVELKKRLGVTFQERVTVIAAVSIYKYQVGECPDFECASQLLTKFKKAGVSGAFIVAFLEEEQITIEKARSLSR